MKPARTFFRLPPSIRITLYYLTFSVMWILLSDQSLNDHQTTKGLGFVVVSALGLGYIIHRNWRAQERSEQRFKAVVENASDIVTILDSTGNQTYQSPAVERVLGYQARELVGRNIAEFAHPDDRGPALEFLQGIMATPGAMGSTDLRVIAKDGTIRDLRSTATNLIDDPSVQGILLNTIDITDRNLAQQQTARQLARLQALHEINLAILENREIRETLDVVLDQVVENLNLDAADVLLYDREKQTLEFAQGTGFRTDAIRQSQVQVGASSPDRTMLSRHPRIVPDIREIENTILGNSIIKDEEFCGYASIPLIAGNRIKGVLELFSKQPLDASPDWQVFANALGAHTAIAIESAQMVESLQQANDELEEVYDRTLEGWAAALELSDDETEGHSRRVVALTLQLAAHIGVDDDGLAHIRRGALLHDIGKIGIPDIILLKPGPLDEVEWEVMRQHPTFAYDLLKAIPYLHPALDIPRNHHERWDGSGYPDGLSGNDIPLHARIFTVVDVYDALTSDRPYRKAWDRSKALQYIRDESGRMFDPEVSAAFLDLMESTPLGGAAIQPRRPQISVLAHTPAAGPHPPDTCRPTPLLPLP